MNVLVTSERRFKQTPDGRVWTSGASDYGFWCRYLDVFDHVRVFARVEQVEFADPSWQAVTGERVSLLPLPLFVGPIEYVANLWRLRAACEQAASQDGAFILRTPGNIAFTLEPSLRRHRRPFGVEVVGDPYEAFAPGAIHHLLRAPMRRRAVSRLQQQCQSACAAAYVTETTLQKRYPPGSNTFSTHYSSVSLEDDAFAPAPRTADRFASPLRLVSVGSMALRYKGFDVLIDAFKRCIEAGLDFHLTLVGSGGQMPLFQKQAEPVRDRITFTGELSGHKAVRDAMRNADLYVHPSKTEGLPRVVIEAMALGLPCIATTVGGTAELLPADALVPPGDVAALAQALHRVQDPDRLHQMSARNLSVARAYAERVLRVRRNDMYRHLSACK